MGRPFPPGISDIEKNVAGVQSYSDDATGVLRPSVRAIYGNTGGFDWDGARAYVPPWVTRVSQHIYNKLRDEVRSNTPYSVKDVTIYLANAMNMLVYMQYVKRNLLATAQYDVRSPQLWKMLVASTTDVAIAVPNKDYGTYESTRYYSDIKVAPAYKEQLGDTWLNTAKLSGTLSYFCLPPRISELLTEYIAAIHVEELDSQYDVLKLGRKSFCYYDHEQRLFVQFEDDQNPATQSFSASGLLRAIAHFDEFISTAPVAFGTLIADMRRIGGMLRLVVEMPPEMGGTVPISASPIFYAGMRNAYNYIPYELEIGYNYELAGQTVFANPVNADEIRINEVVSLDTTDGVGLSLVACFTRDVTESGGTTRNARGLFVIDHEEHMQYDDGSVNPDAFAVSLIIAPVMPFLAQGTLPSEFSQIGLEYPVPIQMCALSARAIIPSLSIFYQFGSGYAIRTMAWDADTSNGTRVSVKMINEILDAFMETLFVA
jgi:hypothetical protein